MFLSDQVYCEAWHDKYSLHSLFRQFSDMIRISVSITFMSPTSTSLFVIIIHKSSFFQSCLLFRDKIASKEMPASIRSSILSGKRTVALTRLNFV